MKKRTTQPEPAAEPTPAEQIEVLNARVADLDASLDSQRRRFAELREAELQAVINGGNGAPISAEIDLVGRRIDLETAARDAILNQRIPLEEKRARAISMRGSLEGAQELLNEIKADIAAVCEALDTAAERTGALLSGVRALNRLRFDFVPADHHDKAPALHERFVSMDYVMWKWQSHGQNFWPREFPRLDPRIRNLKTDEVLQSIADGLMLRLRALVEAAEREAGIEPEAPNAA